MYLYIQQYGWKSQELSDASNVNNLGTWPFIAQIRQCVETAQLLGIGIKNVPMHL